MGCGASSEGGGARGDDVKTILMMGPANSGKTTVIKQIKLEHMNGFSDQEKMELSNAIHQNCVAGLQHLMNQCKASIESSSKDLRDAAKWISGIESVGCCDHESGRCCIHGESLAAMQLLWANPMISGQNLSNGPVENAAFFLNNLDRLQGKNYEPETQDMLCVRKRTEAAGSLKFSMQKQKVSLWDIAGQKLTRFQYNAGEENDISTLVFVASLPDFEGGLVLAEDKNTDRIDDCLKLFDVMCNRFFPDSPVILLLNKFDKFSEYAKQGRYVNSPTFSSVPMQNRKDPKKLVTPVVEQFQTRAPNQLQNESFRYFATTAIDPANMKEILDCIKSIVVSGNVKDFLGF